MNEAPLTKREQIVFTGVYIGVGVLAVIGLVACVVGVVYLAL